MNKLFVFIFFVFVTNLVLVEKVTAQLIKYSIANTHSHNDYEQRTPFWMAYNEGFASIEADIWLRNGRLLIGHDTSEIKAGRTLEEFYLKPLLTGLEKNNGHPFTDASRTLQMLIDIKTDSIFTVDSLVALLKRYPAISGNPSVKWVITGNRPDPSLFPSYPPFIWFDGVLSFDYRPDALARIAMLSDDLKQYTLWNGKGIIPADEREKVVAAIAKSHQLHKPVRFWDAPDFINAWSQLMHLQVDYINTDHIQELGGFLKGLATHTFTGDPGLAGMVYQPTYKTDGLDRPVKNVILLIGDGTGLAQLYTGYTASGGALNIFGIKNIGLSKTSSFDNYVTDSAPGSTAFSSGEKTNNRAVGVDHTGAPLTLLPALLAKKKIRTGLVTCGDITDATPADFYAHQRERDSSIAIIRELKNAPVQLLMGSGDDNQSGVAILKKTVRPSKAVRPAKPLSAFSPEILGELQPEYSIVSSIDSVKAGGEGTKWIVIEKQAGLSMLDGRGDWLQRAFSKTVDILSRNKEGFFIMTEGAQVDYGGHKNSLPYVASEVMDFDQVVRRALEFADKDGETLVIVTADHETGGLSLLDGDYTKGYVSGQFSTNDHSAIPVPVFAYGPRSGLFRGVYENTAIFSKILKAYGL
ncbi:alkaline phosphatase [Flavitalea flava]